jgi:phage repressor protein C with HTH and peptisase S24 domain
MAKSLAKWARDALENSGMGQAELARELTKRLRRNIDRAAVNKMLILKPKKGQKARYISVDEMLAIEEITGFPAPVERPARKAQAVGYVGAGSEVYPIDDHEQGAGLDEVDIPPGVPEDAVLVIVRGDSMYPRYFDNEYLFYMRDSRPPGDFVGRECVVKLDDGRIFVKVLRRGANGFFNLESWNGPMIENKSVEWAAPVLARVNRGGK